MEHVVLHTPTQAAFWQNPLFFISFVAVLGCTFSVLMLVASSLIKKQLKEKNWVTNVTVVSSFILSTWAAWVVSARFL